MLYIYNVIIPIIHTTYHHYSTKPNKVSGPGARESNEIAFLSYLTYAMPMPRRNFQTFVIADTEIPF